MRKHCNKCGSDTDYGGGYAMFCAWCGAVFDSGKYTYKDGEKYPCPAHGPFNAPVCPGCIDALKGLGEKRPYSEIFYNDSGDPVMAEFTNSMDSRYREIWE
jgi:hypothetical protein